MKTGVVIWTPGRDEDVNLPLKFIRVQKHNPSGGHTVEVTDDWTLSRRSQGAQVLLYLITLVCIFREGGGRPFLPAPTVSAPEPISILHMLTFSNRLKEYFFCTSLKKQFQWQTFVLLTLHFTTLLESHSSALCNYWATKAAIHEVGRTFFLTCCNLPEVFSHHQRRISFNLFTDPGSVLIIMHLWLFPFKRKLWLISLFIVSLNLKATTADRLKLNIRVKADLF